MNTGKDSCVLAIGIDAAEPTLVSRLIEQNEMPVLKALLDGGQWLRVQSPAPIGSGAVWPTFMKRRAEKLGGELTINSTDGKGTTLELQIPLSYRSE